MRGSATENGFRPPFADLHGRARSEGAVGSPKSGRRHLLRARDAIDRDFAQPLDIPALARIALCSEAHFIREFRRAFGETPHRYLQRRRIERAMMLLRRTDDTVGEICVAVGFAGAATFSRTFREIVGVSPATFRAAGADPAGGVPTCFEKAWTRPSSFGQARVGGGA